METILIVTVVIAIAIFIISRFKKFANRKYEIIHNINRLGVPLEEAISLYDANHYEISKMISAGSSEKEIAEKYAKEHLSLTPEANPE